MISFDSANKSLSVCVVQIDTNILKCVGEIWGDTQTRLIDLIQNGTLETFITRMNLLNFAKYRIMYAETVDLIPGKKVKETTIEHRTESLVSWLVGLDSKLREIGVSLGDIGVAVPDKERPIVLMEYQMGPNDKSRTVSHQILAWYAVRCRIAIVNPTLKNQTHKGSTAFLNRRSGFNDWPSHGKFLAKYADSYTANKAHTKACLLYWMEHHASASEIVIIQAVIDSVKKCDDIADAFMQFAAWITNEAGLIKDRAAATTATATTTATTKNTTKKSKQSKLRRCR